MINLQFMKQRRRELQLSCTDVAIALGYETRNGYWRIEVGQTKLTAEQLCVLADLFQVDVCAFFTHSSRDGLPLSL